MRATIAVGLNCRSHLGDRKPTECPGARSTQK